MTLLIAASVTLGWAGTAPPAGDALPAGRLERLRAEHVAELERELSRAEPADEIPLQIEVGKIYMGHGAFLEAERWMLEALANTETVHGAESFEAIRVLDQLGQVYTLQRDFERALQYLERARLLSRRHMGSDHPMHAIVTVHFVSALTGAGRIDEAESLIASAEEVLLDAMGPASELAMPALEAHAELHLRRGRIQEAEQALQVALAVRSEGLGLLPDEQVRPGMFPAQALLGELYRSTGLVDQAEPYLIEAAATMRALDENHPLLEPILMNLADVHASRGETAEAERRLGEAERIHGLNIGYAFREHTPRAAIAASLRSPQNEKGLFAAARVGDWVVYDIGGMFKEEVRISQVTPLVVVVKRSMQFAGTEEWQATGEEIWQRNVGLEEFHDLSATGGERTTVRFRGKDVSCLRYTLEEEDGSITAYVAAGLLPIGGLLRLEGDGEVAMEVVDFGRGEEP